MLKYMQNDAYKNIPVKNIAAMVSSGDQQKLGAQKERLAADRAGKTRDPSGSARKPGAGKVDWGTAPKAAFDKKMAEVKGYPA